MSTPLPDDDVREAIRTKLEVSMLVEAAAGTGKTRSLVSRMVSLVRTGRCEIDTMAAITFTIKAAAQLRERFQEEIDSAALEAPPGPERQRLQTARDNLARCFIGTTHSFCGRLLRERPVEAGLDPDFVELEEVATDLLGHEFWTGYVEKLVASGNPLLQSLREAGLSARLLREGFIQLVQYPDVTIIFEQTERPAITHVFEELIAHVEEIVQDLPDEHDGHSPDAFEILIRGLIQRIRVIDRRDVEAQLGLLEYASHASRKPTQKNWPDKKRAKKYGEDYREFVLNRLRPVTERWSEYVHGIAMALLLPAVRVFEEERRHAGRLSFQDLLMRSRDLLRDHPDVRRYFQRRFTHLLVDEFQDTDPVQAEIMFYLTAEDPKERNWRRIVPRPGSLFIVGDPKQSIYRFRRADITTYLQVRDRIRDTGGEIHHLTSNFRSTPAICTFVNDAFRGVFSGEAVAKGRQAQYVELTPARTDGALSGVFSLVSPGNRNEDVAVAEAACLAAWIRNAVTVGQTIDDGEGERPLRWKDFLLVSHGRPRLVFYAEALERAGIPSAVTGSRAFASAQELSQLMPLLRAILDPEDQVSLVAFLRGPLCGVDDQALFEFVEDGGRFSFFHDAKPETTDARLAEGLRILHQAFREARQFPPASTISRLVDRLGLLARAAAEKRGETRSGNLLKALAIAREESGRGASLSAIVDLFGTLLGTTNDIEEMNIDPSAEDAVRLMNLHQVKGLEASVVFLIDPGSPFTRDIKIHVDRSEDASLGYITLWKKTGKSSSKCVAAPAGWCDYQSVESEFARAENERLLYVAGTRARNLLVVGARMEKSGAIGGQWIELAARAPDPLPPSPGPPAVQTSMDFTAAVASPFEEARAEIGARFDEAREISYSVLPVTKLKHGNHQDLVKMEEGLGKGMSWGRVLHRLFEAILRDESLNVRLYAEDLLKDEEREPAEVGEVVEVVDSLRRSPLWQRVLRSPQRLMEVPFAVLAPSAELGLAEEPDTLLHGTIDLVFMENDVWQVVDYKTDRTGGEGRLESLVAWYAPQVQHYVRFWSQLTGQPARGGLFFVDGMIERWLP
ncbi:MAG: UvrD-helicase domain-containing protein [Acidobacteriota bacterium]